MKQTTDYHLTLLLSLLTAASCSALISPCISDGGGWSFQLETNYNVDDENGNDVQCTYEVAKYAFEEQVFNQTSIFLRDNGCTNTAEEEFFAQLGVDTLAEAEDAVYAICGAAQEKMKNYPISDVTYNKGSQFIELYYSGRSTWNEETETLLFPSDGETPVQNLKRDSKAVKAYYEVSKVAPFEMPDLPQFEPSQCTAHAAMCCWPRDRQANDNNGNCKTPYDENCVDKDVADNTDLCYVELGHAPYSSGVDADGFSLFPNDNNNGEGPIHCHGFAWALDDQEVLSRYKANNLFYVSMYDHMYTRGYVENIPGSPMCGCVEDMPVVSRSDCTQTNVDEYYIFTKKTGEPGFSGMVDSVELSYQACQGANNHNNDLSAFVQQLVNDEKLTTNEQDIFSTRVVGNHQCNNAIEDVLESHNFTKGFNVDSDKWTFIVGEGFPDEDPIHDARLFKEMFEDLSVPIVRRVCPTCDATHKDIYYRRLTAMPADFDLLDTLMNNWFDTDNEHNVDFALYSTYMDAFYDENRWTFCNFNDPGVGFPRDCGPNGRVNHNWNSYYRGGGRANHHAFLLPSNPSFESQIVNIADGTHATVTQSTTAHGGIAERAVDGNTIGIWNWGSTTHTNTESNPWWQVSFDYVTAVGEVYIWNRLDCCRDRLNNAKISVLEGEEEVSSMTISEAKVMNVVDFGGVFGDTVRISLPSGGTLNLAEVQVDGVVHTPAPTISAAPSQSLAPSQAPSLAPIYKVKASYYEVTWNSLPSGGFDSFTPYKTDYVPTIDYRAEGGVFATSERSDNVAALFESQLDFDSAGESVTFCLTSDDGSKLKIDGTVVVNNDGLHGDRTICATKTFTGRVEAVVEFFEKGGGATCVLEWERPAGSSRVVVPESVWLAPLTPKLKVSYYEVDWNSLPSGGFDSFTPYKTDVVRTINYRAGGGVFASSERSDYVAALFEGQLEFDSAGESVKFCLISDDGSKLMIDGAVVVDNDGLHGDVTKCETVTLTGRVDVVVEYFEKTGGATCVLEWERGGSSRVVVPTSKWL